MRERVAIDRATIASRRCDVVAMRKISTRAGLKCAIKDPWNPLWIPIPFSNGRHEMAVAKSAKKPAAKKAAAKKPAAKKAAAKK